MEPWARWLCGMLLLGVGPSCGPDSNGGSELAESGAMDASSPDAPSGSDAGPATGAGDGTIAAPIENACAAFARAQCSRLKECAPFGMQVTFGDEADCVARNRVNCVLLLQAPDIATTAGNVNSCAEAYGTASCVDLTANRLPDVCVPLPGKRAAGAGCVTDEQCQSTFCKTDSNASCGVCATKSAEGGSCSGGSNQCPNGLLCSRKLSCVKAGSTGDPCDADHPCAMSLACLGGSCAMPSSTAACTASKDDCGSLAGLVCDSISCQAIQLANAGASCGAVMNKLVYCAASALCKSVCIASVAEGQSCDLVNGPRCAFPAICLGGKCVLRSPAQCP
jgi:hypothetical protein